MKINIIILKYFWHNGVLSRVHYNFASGDAMFRRLFTGVMLSAILMAPTAWAAESLYIYNWSDYFAPDTLSGFETATGIDVVYDVYDSNEVLEAKLYAGNTGYDVVFPTNFPYFYRQQQAGVYQSLNAEKLPNLKGVAPQFLDPLYVNGELYGVPYMWGTIGLGYNVDKVKAALGADLPLDTWAMVFEPEYMEKLGKCKVVFMDSPTYILPILLNYLGLDPNSQNPEDYEKALAKMEAIRPYITYFHDSQYINDLANGNVCVALGWSGDLVMARNRALESSKPMTIQYLNPKEGSLFTYDVMAVPKNAKNYEEALVFMNYILQPQVMASITSFIGYPNPVPASDQFMDASIINDASIYPPESVMEHFFVPKELPLALMKQNNRNWAKMKAQ